MGKSSLCFFPAENLNPSETYVTRVYAGITDNYDNEIEINQSFSFQTGNIDFEIIEIDNLENSVMSNWWAPQSSGSTTGIITDSTWIEMNSEIVNGLFESNQSMEISYDHNDLLFVFHPSFHIFYLMQMINLLLYYVLEELNEHLMDL